jgi:4-aminobutyrate aminotransferase-like enzyme
VVKAVQDQVAKGIHLQQNCMVSRPMVELIDRLTGLVPAGLSKFFFNCESPPQQKLLAADERFGGMRSW